MEIFTLVTGVCYVILEIRQKNFMWYIGMLTSLTAMYMFFTQGLYASFLLNCYYFAMAFWGLYQWRRDAKKMKSGQAADTGEKAKGDVIRLNRLSLKTILLCCLAFVLGLAVLRLGLKALHDPMSGLDAAVAVLSAVATYMLARSYIQQWLLWILADLMSTILCATSGMYWMTALYAVYTLSAVYGYFYWRRNGRYVGESAPATLETE